MRMMSLQGRLALLLALTVALGIALFLGVTRWPLPQWLDGLEHLVGWQDGGADWLRSPEGGLLVSVMLLLPLCIWIAAWVTRPLVRLLRALEGSVASYRDGDFSVSLVADRKDELGELLRMHNELGQTLREQRQNLVQRELLLDTVVQHTPVALVLTDALGHVTYANIAARRLFNEGRALAGVSFDELLDAMPEALTLALRSGEDTLFNVELEGSDETFHVSQRRFRLHGRPHHLYLLRRMTRELARQEVATWKRVIRVISHELNNSLAPISSLSHSGAELVRRGESGRLQSVFASIGERARHLHDFIAGYADFAKLPAPRLADVPWVEFFEGLALQCRFRLGAPAVEGSARFDRGQFEQVLINLVKNAHEAGGAADDVEVRLARVGSEWRVHVCDRGPGMSEVVLAQALLPFYSTKRSGTGLGLALAREILEAHGGRVGLANRDGGGLRVSLILPDARS